MVKTHLLLVLCLVYVMHFDAYADSLDEQKEKGNRLAVSFSEKAEASRQEYITRLVDLLYQYPDKGPLQTPALESSYRDICKLLMASPMPDKVDDKKLKTLMCGYWQSGRHEYLYRSDGTWTMLPEPATSGKWNIKANKLDNDTLILLSKDYCVTWDKNSPFVMKMKRLPGNPYDKDGRVIKSPESGSGKD